MVCPYELILRRPAVYAAEARVAAAAGSAQRPPLHAGFTYELCAGIVDKPGLDVRRIAHEEIMEETGFLVPEPQIQRVTSLVTAIGISGVRQTLFAAEVDSSMEVGAGGGGGGLAEHGEAIEVLALPVGSVDAFLADETLGKGAALLYALLWARERLVAHGGRLFE
jgi:UDP-sugar diphosphatase